MSNQDTPTSRLDALLSRLSFARLESVGLIDVMINRKVGFVGLAGVIVGALLMPPVGLGFDSCTMLRSTGLPCPGCGLTRSVASVLQGHVLAAWQYNPFGFLFAFLFASSAPLAILPNRIIDSLRRRLQPYAVSMAICLIVGLVGLFVHGIVRAGLVLKKSPSQEWWWRGRPVPPAFAHLAPSESPEQP
jgi:hypothetical protein